MRVLSIDKLIDLETVNYKFIFLLFFLSGTGKIDERKMKRGENVGIGFFL